MNAMCLIISVSSSALSVGLRFYYWFKYKDMEVAPESGGMAARNIIHHSGYNIADMYINKKYSTLKEEICNYQYIPNHAYNKIIMPKALSYYDTNYVKSIKAAYGPYIPQYYEIPKNSMITLSHVISVILYCDYTKLSGHFSSTFRKKGVMDTLQNIKSRNREYFWMSKLLRETVEIFGETLKDGLAGPFYSGLSVVLNIPNFFIRLSSPTSTSVQIQVAIKFGGDDGIILQLNNPKGTSQCTHLRGFNCSFISAYKEEAERYNQ